MASSAGSESTGPSLRAESAERAGSCVDEVGALLQAVATGNRIAFRQLYDRVAGRVLMTALRILRDQALAEDAAQEAFVKIWRHAGNFRPERGAGLAWIGVIARNAALDRVSSRRETTPIEDIDLGSYQAEPADARLMQCLAKLPEPRGKALVYMYVHGLTHRELADKLSAPIGTVKSWIRRGAMELRECLKE